MPYREYKKWKSVFLGEKPYPGPKPAIILVLWALAEHKSIWYRLQEYTESATAELKWQMKGNQVSRNSGHTLLLFRTVKVYSPQARQQPYD